MYVSHIGSSDLASSLAAGSRLPIQASDDTQADNPVKLKVTTTDTAPPTRDDVRIYGPLRSTTAPSSVGVFKPSHREREPNPAQATQKARSSSSEIHQTLQSVSSSDSDRSDTKTTDAQSSTSPGKQSTV